MRPLARTAHLVIQELADETLVFDQRARKAHCLNRTTAVVWQHCDGRTDLAGLARLVEGELAIAGGAMVVQLALEQLASRNLLEGTIERGSPAQRRSRREVLKRMAAAAVVLPVILTVAAPRASAAGSNVCAGKPDNTTCGTNQICCSSTCCGAGFVCASGQCGPATSCSQIPTQGLCMNSTLHCVWNSNLMMCEAG